MHIKASEEPLGAGEWRSRREARLHQLWSPPGTRDEACFLGRLGQDLADDVLVMWEIRANAVYECGVLSLERLERDPDWSLVVSRGLDLEPGEEALECLGVSVIIEPGELSLCGRTEAIRGLLSHLRMDNGTIAGVGDCTCLFSSKKEIELRRIAYVGKRSFSYGSRFTNPYKLCSSKEQKWE